MTSRRIRRVLVCRLISEWTCGCCSYGSPIQGRGQKGGESPRVMNLDLRAVGQGTRPAPDGKMPASLGQPFVVKTECLHGVSSRGGPSSEMGSRSRRERERVRGSGNVRSRRGRSEAAGTRAKGGRYSIAYDDPLGCILWVVYSGLYILGCIFWVVYPFTGSREQVYIHFTSYLSISNTARGSRTRSE